MAIPQFDAEGVDQTGTGTITCSFAGFTFATGEHLEIVIATDGDVPVIATANGFAFAQDPLGNVASVSTNGGTAGAAECGIFVLWKHATGNTATTDPPPVFGARTGGGTSWCLQPNSFSGARSGNPYHAITTAIVSTAATAVSAVGATSTLTNCLFMPRAASSNDDQAFNNWTMTGSASPSGTKPPDTGWHAAGGNACAFIGDEGGFAAAHVAATGFATSSFATTTKQALVTLVLASLPEAGAPAEDAAAPWMPALARLWVPAPASFGEEIPGTAASIVEDDPTIVPPPRQLVAPVQSPTVADDLPVAASASVLDEDSPAFDAPSARVAALSLITVDDDLPIAAAPAMVYEDPPSVAAPAYQLGPPSIASSAVDEIPTTSGSASAVDHDSPALAWFPAPVRPPILTLTATDDFIPALTPVAIGGAADAQRSFDAAPQTGTLTTPAPIPAWAQSHAYVVDPTAGGINRVLNGGTLYQCSSPGTSAGSGTGPNATTIGTTQGDGGVTWYVIGPAQGTSTIAGSQIIATVMRGNQSLAGSVDPTDNDGGTYTAISNTSYGGAFPTAFAGVWRRTTAANNKTGFTLSAVWGGSGGAGDELSLAWIELQGVTVGAPHAFSEVDRANSTGGTVTAGAITTTKRCLIVSYWFGIGTVQADGDPDAATPAGGLTPIAGSTGPLSLTVNGYIQHMAAFRIANPGTFAEVWTTSPTDQGAKLVTVAFEDPTVQAISVDDDSPRIILTWAPQRLLLTLRADDELPLVTTVAEDESRTWTPVLAPALVVITAPTDEVPSQIIEDESPQTMAVTAPARMIPAAAVDDELPALTAAVIDDDSGPPAAPAAVRLQAFVVIDEDPLATPSSVAVIEDDAVTGWTAGRVNAQAPERPADDGDIAAPAAPSVVDEDTQATYALPRAGDPPPATLQGDDLPAVAPPEDPGQPERTIARAAPAQPTAAADIDDLPATAPVLEVDAPPAWWSTGPLPLSPRSIVDEDAVPIAPTPPPPIVDDDGNVQPYAPWRLYDWTAALATVSDDVLPTGSALPQPPAAFYGVRVVSRYVAVLITGRVTTVVIDGVPNG